MVTSTEPRISNPAPPNLATHLADLLALKIACREHRCRVPRALDRAINDAAAHLLPLVRAELRSRERAARQATRPIEFG